MVESSLLFDLGLVIIAASAISLLMKLLRQPLVLGYVAGGVLIGPAVFQFVKNPTEIAVLSDLGIAFLLFVIGLELDFKKVRQVGVVFSMIGLLQVILTVAVGFAVGLIMGFNPLTSFYIALGVSFSSTMVVIKLLSDNKELESLHGELVLGIMLVQDVIAIFALSLLPSIQSIGFSFLFFFVLKVGLFAILIFVANALLLPWLMRQVAHNSELLFLGALSVIFFFAYLANLLGFSLAIGAFIAGLALSASPLHLEIRQKVEPLRDFFLVMFFVTLGMQVSFRSLGSLIVPLIAFILVGVFAKGIITYFLLKFFKYGNRTSFFTGVQIAQVGEFSLVLAALGVSLGHLTIEVSSLLTFVTLITILIATYLIRWDDSLFNLLPKFLPFFEKSGSREDSLSKVERNLKDHIVVFGFHKMAPIIMRSLIKKKMKFVIVDHNPEKIRTLSLKGINCICGSIANEDVYEKAGIEKASIVISTINFVDKNKIMLKKLKSTNPKSLAIVAASNASEAVELYSAGADYVIVPDSLSGEKVANYMEHLSPQGIRDWGRKHFEIIKQELKESERWK